MKKYCIQVGHLEVAYLGNTVYEFLDGKQKSGVYLPKMSWCEEVIAKLTKQLSELEAAIKVAVATTGKDWHPEGYRVKQLKDDIFHWKDVLYPRVLKVYKKRATDSEVEYNPDNVTDKSCGSNRIYLVKGKGYTIASLNAKSGDRIICIDSGIKFIFLSQQRWTDDFMKAPQFNCLIEEIMAPVVLTDSEHYQKLARPHNFFN
ncbi:MAG TPA: hypothetical protein VK541_05050 [Pedobacter sp.]|uniref:hypothetical protein n=1 Tax=Pedobacter sp. TaxID=1411316 RepID=UPI002C8BEF1E|nr:hypothetical protein [Pedobacter sp.]HMI01827.1 hypothetical protein [Pedobacter sp.]